MVYQKINQDYNSINGKGYARCVTYSYKKFQNESRLDKLLFNSLKKLAVAIDKVRANVAASPPRVATERKIEEKIQSW